MASPFIKKHIDKKIIYKLRLLAISFLILLGIMVFNIVKYPTLIWATLIAIFIGYFIGKYIVLRVTKFQWDEKAVKIITHLDRISKIILVLYLLLMIARHWFLGQFFQGTVLMQVIISSSAGIVLGRIFGSRQELKKLLEVLKKEEEKN